MTPDIGAAWSSVGASGWQYTRDFVQARRAAAQPRAAPAPAVK
jgi:hypothetical protein